MYEENRAAPYGSVVYGALAGCSKRQETVSKTDPYVIGVVTKSRDSEYWMSVCSGMEKAADEEGVSVLIVSPDTETDVRLQKNDTGSSG